jgi:hypothetical protein
MSFEFCAVIDDSDKYFIIYFSPLRRILAYLQACHNSFSRNPYLLSIREELCISFDVVRYIASAVEKE